MSILEIHRCILILLLFTGLTCVAQNDTLRHKTLGEVLVNIDLADYVR